MKIKVTNCVDCPFHQYEYDGWSTGYDSSHKCMLAVKLKLKESYIAVYDSKDEEDLDFEIKTPDWCPLLNDKIEVEYEL
jgi:hypothetical protein